MPWVSLLLLLVLEALLCMLSSLRPLPSWGNHIWCDAFGWESRPTALLSTSLMKLNPILHNAHAYATPSHTSTVLDMMDYLFVLILST